jgi:hypothetical protein
LVLGGALAGASVMLAALGYYVLNRTRAADQAAAAVAASARALIEAENARKLREAEQRFWDGGAGPKSEVRRPAAGRGSDGSARPANSR